MLHRVGVDTPLEVADSYALSLLSDQTTRLHAAVERWAMPLGDWIEIHSIAIQHARAGIEHIDWPWLQEPTPTEAELARARQVMAERSAIPD